MWSLHDSVNRLLQEILSQRSNCLINPGFAVTLKWLVLVFFCGKFGGGFTGDYPIYFLTLPAAVVVAVSVPLVLTLNSHICGFWGSPFRTLACTCQ